MRHAKHRKLNAIKEFASRMKALGYGLRKGQHEMMKVVNNNLRSPFYLRRRRVLLLDPAKI